MAALRRLRLAVIYRPRAGFGYAVRFQLALAAVLEKRALASGAAAVRVGESGEPANGACAPRRVTRMVLPDLARSRDIAVSIDSRYRGVQSMAQG